jgi:hypothetical protein
MAIFNSQKPTAATKTQELGGVLKELDAARAEHEALLVTATTDGDDSRLANLRSRIERLAIKEGRIRNEIAGAMAAERLVERDKAFDAAVAIGNQAAQAGAELAKVIAGIWPAVRKLIELDDAFRAAVPVRPPDWDEHAFTRDLISLILNELYVASEGRLRGTTGLVQSPHQLAQNPLFTISGALREHLAMGLKAQPSTHAAVSTSATGGEAVQQGE